MSVKSKLKYTVKNLLSRDNTGSFASRYDRQKMLFRFVQELVDLGYKLTDIQGLKQKHIIAIVEHWQKQHLSDATIKNRLAVVRRLASLMNKTQVVPTNKALTIGARQSAPIKNRALHQPDFSGVTDGRGRFVPVRTEEQRYCLV